MEKQIGIWIDSKEALIISPESGKLKKVDSAIENLTVSTHRTSKQAVSDTKLLNKKNKQVKDFCATVLSEISEPEAIYLFGPSQMKIELEREIKEDSRFQAVSLFVDTADSMTQNQLIERVRSHFNGK